MAETRRITQWVDKILDSSVSFCVFARVCSYRVMEEAGDEKVRR